MWQVSQGILQLESDFGVRFCMVHRTSVDVLLIIRFSLNSPDSKIGTRVTYCESLDEFLCAKSRYDLKHKKISENQ